MFMSKLLISQKRTIIAEGVLSAGSAGAGAGAATKKMDYDYNYNYDCDYE